MAYDPWYDYGQDPYAAYGYQDYPYEEQPYEEDTESQQLRREQEQIEEIEANRLYLRKVRKRCVQEDFVDLGKTQMFLFEFLIERLEVNSKIELGLVKESNETKPEIAARVQFLDTPYLMITEKGETNEGSDSILGQTEYFETVGNAGLSDAIDPSRTVGVEEESPGGSVVEEKTSGEEEPVFSGDTCWENSSGKSLLFSKTALEVIQGLDRSPVKVQVSRCTEPTEEEEKGTCEPLGYTLIYLPEHFSLSVLQSCKPGVILPVSCVHRELCEIKNVFGVKKAEMQVLVRLSCFGSVITTSFQSVGPERRYVFKPSPQPDSFGSDESELKRDMVLKPIFAEEEAAIGITIVKDDEDVFQKTVLWKDNTQNCGCMGLPSDLGEFRESSLRMPRPSGVTLCRDANPSRQPGNPTCDWHSLVSKEIKNSPGGNCGCLDDVKVIKSPDPSNEMIRTRIPTLLREKSVEDPQTIPRVKPSRIEKMQLRTRIENQPMSPKVPEKTPEPVTGLMIQPQPPGCNCDCAPIRASLANSPMMKHTWQVK